MLTLGRYQLAVLLVVTAAVLVTSSSDGADEPELSEDFRNGSVFGQAIQARHGGNLCLELLQAAFETDEDERPDPMNLFDPHQPVWAHLFYTVYVVHHAVELPEDALPGNSRQAFEAWLRRAADHLYETIPDMIDPAKVEIGEEAFLESLGKAGKSDKLRAGFLQIYHRQVKTAKILAKYRSPQPLGTGVEKAAEAGE